MRYLPKRQSYKQIKIPFQKTQQNSITHSQMQLKQPQEHPATSSPLAREQPATNQRVHDEEYNYQYYEEYKRLYQTAYLLSLQLKQLNTAKDDLWVRLVRLEKKAEDFKDDIRGEPPERKKRFRRTAEEISRNYVCEVQKCNKCYGSEGSLQQHIKLKHPELYELRVHRKDAGEGEGSGEDEGQF